MKEIKTGMTPKIKTSWKIRRLLRINSMTCVLSTEGVKNCANYISYRVQRALYDIFHQCDNSLEWDQFVSMLRKSRAMREAAQTVAVTAVKNIGFEQFDFKISEYVDLGHDLPDEEMEIAALFEGDAGEGLAILLMLRAEIAHHRTLCRGQSESYTLKRYMRDLKKDDALREALIRALRKAIGEMDFHEIWMRGGIWRMAELTGMIPKKLRIETLTIEKAFEDI